jgi:hypothetical protein
MSPSLQGYPKLRKCSAPVAVIHHQPGVDPGWLARTEGETGMAVIPEIQPPITELTVRVAVWGGRRGKNPDDVPTADVTDVLQTQIKKSMLGGGPNSGHVKIDRLTFGDPAGGVEKHFGAVVDYPGGRRRFFACKEDDTVDFT